MGRRLLVSVFADASYCHDTGAAGWGGWAKSDRGRVYNGGPLKDVYRSVALAELAAVANALEMAVQSGVAPTGCHVLVQTDNDQVVRYLNGEGHANGMEPRRLFERVRNIIRYVLKDHDITLSARHVRGHQGTAVPRNAVNEMCDKKARQGMRAARSRWVARGSAPSV